MITQQYWFLGEAECVQQMTRNPTMANSHLRELGAGGTRQVHGIPHMEKQKRAPVTKMMVSQPTNSHHDTIDPDSQNELFSSHRKKWTFTWLCLARPNLSLLVSHLNQSCCFISDDEMYQAPKWEIDPAGYIWTSYWLREQKVTVHIKSSRKTLKSALALCDIIFGDIMFHHLVLWLYMCVDTKTQRVPAQNWTVGTMLNIHAVAMHDSTTTQEVAKFFSMLPEYLRTHATSNPPHV